MLLLFAPAIEAAAPAPSIEIVAFGNFSAAPPSGWQAPAPGQETLADVVERPLPSLLAAGPDIVARPCAVFGLEYRLAGAGAWPPGLRVEVEHPPITAPDGRRAEVETYTVPTGPGVRFVGFAFDEPWEMVPGRWRIALRDDGRELAGEDFIVTVPPGADAGSCHGRPNARGGARGGRGAIDPV